MKGVETCGLTLKNAFPPQDQDRGQDGERGRYWRRGGGGEERERHGERGGERERERERAMEREGEREREPWRERGRERERESHGERGGEREREPWRERGRERERKLAVSDSEMMLNHHRTLTPHRTLENLHRTFHHPMEVDTRERLRLIE